MVLNYIAAYHQNIYPQHVSGIVFWVWRTAVWFFEMTLCFGVVITLIYWVFLSVEEEFALDWHHLYGIFIHILPLSCTLIDFYMQFWLFRSAHFFAIAIFATAYGFVNFIVTEETGEPLYPILVWDPIWESLLLCLAGLIVFAIIFAVAVYIT